MTSAGTDTTVTYRMSWPKLVMAGIFLALITGVCVYSFVVPDASDLAQFSMLAFACLAAFGLFIACISKVTVAPERVTVYSLRDPHVFERGSATLEAAQRYARFSRYTELVLTDTRDGTKRTVNVNEIARRKRDDFMADVATALDQPVPLVQEISWLRGV